MAKPANPRRSRHALPSFVAPQLSTLVDSVPAGDRWLYEIKYDGYRAIIAAAGDQVRCYSRSGIDWTARYGQIPEAIAKLQLDGALIDGEIVAMDHNGVSNFTMLQGALKNGGRGLALFAFDLLQHAGADLRRLPLVERKKKLQALLKPAGKAGPIFYSDHVVNGGGGMHQALCAKGFEGVIAKLPDRPYASGRSTDWLKIKCGYEQEFIIIGYTLSDRGRSFASLILAAYDAGQLRYMGRVGTGFSDRTLAELAKLFAPIERDTPAAAVPREIRRRSRWMEPRLVAQVRFAEFTGDEKVIRHGSFLGLREDKKAGDVVVELPIGSDGQTPKRKKSPAPSRSGA